MPMYKGKNHVKAAESYSSEGLMKSNPDKGYMGNHAGYMKDEKYRGNEYNYLYEKVMKSDDKKIKNMEKHMGYRY